MMARPGHMTWEHFLRRRQPRVADRIRKFYPDGPPVPGTIIRGWHPSAERFTRWMFCDFVTRAFVIKHHGRAAWNGIPRELIHKEGWREYVAWHHLDDQVWMMDDRARRALTDSQTFASSPTGLRR